MNRETLTRAQDGDLIGNQCHYISPIDGQPCQDDAGHEPGHSISGNPRHTAPIDADALLARVREIRAEQGNVPAPRTEQAQALADLITGKK